MSENNGQVKVHQADDWPWHTQDAILAFCLYMAGIPFFDEKHPCVCEYNLGNLQALKKNDPAISGPIEDAVDIAIAKKKKGHTVYGFRQVLRLKDMVGAYIKQCKEIEEGDGTAAELELRLASLFAERKIQLDEFLCRLNCVSAKMRKEFMDMWQHHVFIRIDKPGKSSVREFNDGKREGHITKSRGFTIYPRNASPQLREKLGI